MTEVSNNLQRHFYRPFCNESEIDRILNVNSGRDYLLKLRADTIADHMRLFRVYRNYALLKKGTFSLEESFRTEPYSNFMNNLDAEKKELCSELTYGNIFSNEPNGQIFKTEYNPIITICDSLRYFFKFMNLGLMDFQNRVPAHVSKNSIRIALRVMLQTEALDFLMDPRGIIPLDIIEDMHQPISYQMQFIAGHEFSHFILGHLTEDKLKNKPIFKAIFPNQEEYGFQNTYNYSQKNEFEADEKSIEFGNYNKEQRIKVFEAALLWFASLDLYESIENYISPPIGYLSHPPARDRYENLLDKVKLQKGYDYTKWKRLPELINYYKEIFIEDVALNIDDYETYGSVYLDKPNTEWRGKELKDREDYY